MSNEKTWEEIITNFLNSERDNEIKDDLISKMPQEIKSKIDNLRKGGNESLNEYNNRIFDILSTLDIDDIDKCELEAKRKEIYTKYKPNVWLREKCVVAKNMKLSTHTFKLTHSSSVSTAIIDSVTDVNEKYFTTSSLACPSYDCTNNILDGTKISKFCNLKLNSKTLIHSFIENNSIFDAFLSDDEYDIVDSWVDSFNILLSEDKKDIDYLVKQVYFPINNNNSNNDNDEYYLMCNVVSSSIANVIYDYKNNITEQPKKYSGKEYIDIPNSINIKVTTSNPQNVSHLNIYRDSKLYLLSTEPPKWESKLKPPIDKKSLFDAIYGSDFDKEFKYLCDFLVIFKDINLSIKNPKRYKHVERWMYNIIDMFLCNVSNIHNIEKNWTDCDNIKLKIEHQYFLDPHREDDEFQYNRSEADWQETILNDFAVWVNKKLKHENKKFTPQSEYTNLWKKMLKNKLMDYISAIEH